MIPFNSLLTSSLDAVKSPKRPQNETLQQLPDSWVEALFTQFELDYGNKFAQKWAHANDEIAAQKLELVSREWAKKLAPVRDVLSPKLLEEVAKRYPSWPPEINEFLAVCREFRTPPTAHRPFTPSTHQLTNFGDPRSAEAIEARTRCLATMAACKPQTPAEWRALKTQKGTQQRAQHAV